jgi:hypothetical protein
MKRALGDLLPLTAELQGGGVEMGGGGWTWGGGWRQVQRSNWPGELDYIEGQKILQLHECEKQ